MADDPRIQQLLGQLLSGHATPEEVCATCPELLPVVRNRLRQMRRLRADLDALFPPPDVPSTKRDALGPSPEPTPRPPAVTGLPQIPGYEVEAVLGRGGMGVVYQARHLRLNRPVALKMLLGGAYAGPHERARFQREAEAVAGLRHENIVRVYDVGDHDGRPFFTMEYVEGGSLADQLTGAPQPARQAAALVATLAEAVRVAHQGGVVHRDLKPGNVLLTADGTAKVSDFGLARRLQGGAALTQSGVPVGTPSYMAPEQARGQARAIGPAVDVYALGAILYELLTGRPPFRGETAAATLQEVITRDPVPPTRLNSNVPRDLDTICLKCLHKEPGRRYASAAALADDLRRFGEGRPIQARPVGWAERSWRWCRRNPTRAALLASTLALVGLASGGGVWVVQQRARHDAELRSDVGTAVTQAESLRKGFHFREAQELLGQARQRLEAAGPDDLRGQVDQARADLDLAENLDKARLQAARLVAGRYDKAGAEPLYASAFADAGLGREGDDSEVVAARVRDSALSAELVAALDDWASITPDPGRREWLLAVASKADGNPARNRLRQMELGRDGARLARIAEEGNSTDLSPQLATALGRVVGDSGGDAVPLLTAAQARYPQDFWLNLELGFALYEAQRYDEALGYYRAALALRPKVSVVHDCLGLVLLIMGRLDEAMGPLQEALRLDPKNGRAHASLGLVLRDKGRLEEAIDHFQQAVSIDPKDASAHVRLGVGLHDKGRLGEAIDHFQQAISIDPEDASARGWLSQSLYPAARAAVLDAAGLGSEKAPLGEAERADKRRHALGWLRAHLELTTKMRNEGKLVGWSLSKWQTDSALASVREPAALATLPDAERAEWQRLWADVATIVATDPLVQGQASAARRDWVKAADSYARVLKRGPTDDGLFWFEYAAVSLLTGDRPGYARACAHMIETSKKAGGPRSYLVARACTLAPDAVTEAALPGRLAAKELKENAGQFWSLTEQGALAYRAGRFQEAVPLFERSLEADAKPGRAVLNWLWLALTNHRLDKAEEARRWLGKAQAWLDQYRDGMPADAEEKVGLHLHNWLEAHVLRREAEALLAPR
jgi:serine/threonine-protein kinase